MPQNLISLGTSYDPFRVVGTKVLHLCPGAHPQGVFHWGRTMSRITASRWETLYRGTVLRQGAGWRRQRPEANGYRVRAAPQGNTLKANLVRDG